MAYSKYPSKYEKPKPIPPDFLVKKWQRIGVLGSQLAMAIVSNAPQEEVIKLASQYNTLYAEAINS
jgi:hypothetical protein